MTLLSAFYGCYETLPILVVTSEESEPANAIAYANGARICLSKPLPPGLLASVIVDLQSMPSEGCLGSSVAGRPKGHAAARSLHRAICNFQVTQKSTLPKGRAEITSRVRAQILPTAQ